MNNQSLAPMAMQLAGVPTAAEKVTVTEKCELRCGDREKTVTLTIETPKGEERKFAHWAKAVRYWHPGWGLEQVLFKNADVVVEMPTALEAA